MNVIILAGGNGTRLAPWHAPKCLMPVNGVTILQRLVNHIGMQPLETLKVFICVGYRSSDVVQMVDHCDWLAEFSDAGTEAAMGARLMKAYQDTDRGRCLICYGDELADVDIKALLEAHGNNAMTFAAKYAKTPGGTVYTSENTVRIVEDHETLINIGFVVVEPVCWAYLKPEDGLSDWINRTAEQTRVGVYQHKGRRATINSLADIRAAEEMFK